jgi:hypothetical protein
MSLSRECDACPFNEGFEMPEGAMLRVCGDPAQRCINLRGMLQKQLPVWERLTGLAEVSKNGILYLDLLREGDIVEVFATAVGRPYGTELDRRLAFSVSSTSNGSLEGKVLEDTYNDAEIVDDKALWAVPEGHSITIHGSIPHQIIENNIETGEPMPGELHVGRFISYTPQDHEDSQWGLYVQEVRVRDAQQTVVMPLFDTDPSTHRPAPQLR